IGFGSLMGSVLDLVGGDGVDDDFVPVFVPLVHDDDRLARGSHPDDCGAPAAPAPDRARVGGIEYVLDFINGDAVVGDVPGVSVVPFEVIEVEHGPASVPSVIVW